MAKLKCYYGLNIYNLHTSLFSEEKIENEGGKKPEKKPIISGIEISLQLLTSHSAEIEEERSIKTQ